MTVDSESAWRNLQYLRELALKIQNLLHQECSSLSPAFMGTHLETSGALTRLPWHGESAEDGRLRETAWNLSRQRLKPAAKSWVASWQGAVPFRPARNHVCVAEDRHKLFRLILNHPHEWTVKCIPPGRWLAVEPQGKSWRIRFPLCPSTRTQCPVLFPKLRRHPHSYPCWYPAHTLFPSLWV